MTDSKTPLHHRWTLWYDNPRLAPKGTEWRENLQDLGTFETAEEFWSIFNNVQPASQLPLNSNYHLFKEGIEPMWEDPQNIEGGKFVFTLPKEDVRSGKCDKRWLYTVLAMIGETMDASGEKVCGSVVSIRKSHSRIALWLKCCDKELCSEIGGRWKRCLNVSNKIGLKYQSHRDAAAAGKSLTNEIMFEI